MKAEQERLDELLRRRKRLMVAPSRWPLELKAQSQGQYFPQTVYEQRSQLVDVLFFHLEGQKQMQGIQNNATALAAARVMDHAVTAISIGAKKFGHQSTYVRTGTTTSRARTWNGLHCMPSLKFHALAHEQPHS